MLFVPTRKGRKKEKRDEREDDGDDEEVWKDHGVFERVGDPDEVERILVDGDLLGEERGVVGAEEVVADGVTHAETKVSDSDFHACGSHDVLNCGGDTRVDLSGIVGGCVSLVVEGYEEDAGDEG